MARPATAFAAIAAAAGALARATPVAAMAPPSDGNAAVAMEQAVVEEVPTIVPITRDFLRAFYARYSDPTLSAAATAVRARLAAVKHVTPPEPPPHRMDECMYAARCACEEGAFALKSLQARPRAAAAARSLHAAGDRFEAFQDAQRAHVSAMVSDFLPADFRARLFHAARARSEERNKAAVSELVARGGTIREKYDLLWEQQWARRETLSAVGNATGVWKLAVRYIAGVPQPLLDFARQINVPNGPTEELRLKFGPVLTTLVTFAAELRAFAVGVEDPDEPALSAFADAAANFQEEVDSFCTLLTKVVEESPFFVTPQQIEAIKNTKP